MDGGRKLKVLVIGGGVGGLTAGIAFSRAGFDVDVYERAADERQIQIGAGTHLWSNAIRVYQKLGIADQIEASGSPVEHTEFWTSSGKLLADWDIGDLGRSLDAPSIGVIRAEVQKVLTGAVDKEHLHFGAECTGFSQDAGGVTARFADGQEVRGDVLVGADGINSAVRAQILGASEAPYAGWTYWQGVNTEHTELCPPTIHRILTGAGAKFIFHHAGEGRLCWLAMVRAPAGRPDGPNGRKADVLARFKGWMEPTEAIIETTDEGRIRHQDMYHRRTAKVWGQGRVTMLGDAAHAMTSHVGQGACQAIEDAYVLSKCLGQNGDAASALRAYESQRIKRTTLISNTAWRMGSLQRMENPLACAVRDRFMRVMLSSIGGRENAKFVSYQV